MKLIQIILTSLFLFSSSASADPSVSSESKLDTETSQSSSMKRDKSMSSDRARGNRDTRSKSNEHSLEASKSKSHSERDAQEWQKSNSYSADININGLLLRLFSQRYERAYNGEGMAGMYFFTCKPLLNSLVDYPVWDLTSGDVVGRSEAMRGNGGYSMMRGDGLVAPWVDSTNPYIARYAQCRMTASYFLADAADLVSSQEVTTEAQVADRIREVFHQFDADDSIFQEHRQRAREVWRDANCSNWLDTFDKFKEPEIKCGVFDFVGRSFYVENRETLSEGAINGRSYKVALSASESESYTVDNTTARDERSSLATRESVSKERFRESKNSASMSKSRSTESSRSNKQDTSSGSSMTATPTK